MRLSHLHFLNGKPVRKNEPSDRIVTIYWSIDDDILTYGATVFKREHSKDHWKKKLHKQTALKRYTDTPVLVKLYSDYPFPQEISSFAMDWFIAKKLLFKFGAYNKNPDNLQIHRTQQIYPDFNQEYSYLEEYEDDVEECEKESGKSPGCLPFFFTVGIMWGAAIFGKIYLS